ncbi:hypothetical protein [Candidatus Uabimicrobium sp. HlEnr_7]|uniref:hypothetical protein n=1 Tax=Candidatus Uabimicrobium helgolandensis TaxID=3095367 RepID=UPI003558D532
MVIEEVAYKYYTQLTEGKKTVTRSRGGGLVIVEKERIIKVFSPKKKGLYFYQFIENVTKLQKLNVPIMELMGTYHVEGTPIFYMIYKPLVGVTLRDHLKQSPEDCEIIKELASFFAHIHKLGIYFRAVHFGNIIVLPEGGFGLIDFGNMIIRNKSLNPWFRARNFRLFTRKNYQQDFAQIAKFGVKSFMEEYLQECRYSWGRKQVFYMWLRMYCNKFNAFL